MAGVPVLAPTPVLARRWSTLLQDLLARVTPGAAGSVDVAGSTTTHGNLVVDGTAAVTGAFSAGGTASATGQLSALGGLVVAGVLRPAAPTGAQQAAVSLYAANGVPSNATGANGDFCLRGDGGAGTCLYHKEAGVWVGRA
jgi:hypothetical protein